MTSAKEKIIEFKDLGDLERLQRLVPNDFCHSNNFSLLLVVVRSPNLYSESRVVDPRGFERTYAK